MKQLLLIRHAKSSWDSAEMTDFDRPLNDRGKKDALRMVNRLNERNVTIDLFVSSTANRAQSTARIFMEQLLTASNKLILINDLYLAPSEVFYNVIVDFDDSFQSVALFSHNPGITDFVNSLTTMHTNNVPTCGIFAVSVNTNNWRDFKKAEKQFLFYDYPKLIA
jgi:phosphohistidine phosphatase